VENRPTCHCTGISSFGQYKEGVATVQLGATLLWLVDIFFENIVQVVQVHMN
jgi:hypothetical protein